MGAGASSLGTVLLADGPGGPPREHTGVTCDNCGTGPVVGERCVATTAAPADSLRPLPQLQMLRLPQLRPLRGVLPEPAEFSPRGPRRGLPPHAPAEPQRPRGHVPRPGRQRGRGRRGGRGGRAAGGVGAAGGAPVAALRRAPVAPHAARGQRGRPSGDRSEPRQPGPFGSDPGLAPPGGRRGGRRHGVRHLPRGLRRGGRAGRRRAGQRGHPAQLDDEAPVRYVPSPPSLPVLPID